jgi:hypothetical protein
LAEDFILAKIHHLTKKEASALISQLDRQDCSFFGAAAPATGPEPDALEPKANAMANRHPGSMTDAQPETIGNGSGFDQPAADEAQMADGGGFPPFVPTTEGVEF